ncbi:MAG: glycosyltransferase [Solirubrobacterales bacterium]|nr:glycosyltransferase [Solirubrobacterales bacterium]
MALRLTGIPTPDDSTGSAGDAPARLGGGGLRIAAAPQTAAAVPVSESGSGFGARLREQARLQLAVNQLDRYKALFDRAAEHEDSHARYHARVLLIEEGLSASSKAASTTQATQLFVAVADGALRALEEEPREPVLLNYAGVALYELWSLDAARALFKAAQRLDPALPHLTANLRELERRRKGYRPGKPLHASVPGLSARARKLAPKAQPARNLTLGLCMIVKDEEEMLPKCLAAAAPAVDEIIVVDTGSTDHTVEIAREFGAKVIEQPWTGSFSDARNTSFEHATTDWIIYLDADEVLAGDDVKRLRSLTGRVWREAFYLVMTSFTGEGGTGEAVTNSAMRVFRNRPHYRFEGRLHEQIAQQLPTYAVGRIEHCPVRVDHYGYLGAVRDAKEKSRRNLELLKAQQSEGTDTAFLHFNLGTEYSVLGDYRSALTEFERSWDLVKVHGELENDYVPALVYRLVTALRSCGRLHEAITRAQDGLERFPGFTDLVYSQAQAALTLGEEIDAISYWERCIEMGDAPARYGAAVGAGTYRPRIALAELYLGRGELEPARALLDWCLAEHPDFLPGIDPYVSLQLRSGADPAVIAEQVEEHLGSLSAAVHFILGGTFYRHGAMAAAETQFQAVLRARPNSAQSRVQLAEALLHQRRYAEAASEAARVADEDPYAGLAARIELSGRIAGGDLGGAAEASARAARVGVSAAEREVFAGWLQIAGGAEEPLPSLPVVATPLLGVLLETLLRAHDFEGFERLIPLLHNSALPEREQREVLASMYLDQGFLPQAAQEWMAVCAAQPDARSLIGLARVAERSGQIADAAVFAGEALALDPASTAARELVRRCAHASGPEMALTA